MTGSEEINEKCASCGSSCSLACSSCNKVYYCNREHQKSHWNEHKASCMPWVKRESEECGRYLVAQRDLPAGTLVLKESPFVLGPQASSPSICLECYTPLSGSKMDRCGLCHWPMCGQNCAVSKKHIQECLFLQRDTKHCGVPTAEGETPRYDLILVLRCLLLRFTNRSAYKKLLKMVSHAEKRKEDAEPHHVAAIRYMKEVCRLENKEDEIHHVRGAIITNSINSKNSKGVTLRGLYPTVSLLNHSCLPNLTIRTDEHRTVFIHTTTDVKKDQQLVFSYVPACNPIWSRQSELKYIYYFTCRCQRCSDPSECGTNFSSPLCKNCPNEYLHHGGVDTLNWKCQLCGASRELSDIIKEAQDYRTTLNDVPSEPSAMCTFLESVAGKFHKNHVIYLEAMQVALRKLRNACNSDELNMKVRLWKDILEAYNKLEPGSTRRRGVSLVELSKAIADSTEKDHTDVNKSLLQDALLLSKEASNILSLEPQYSTEGHWRPLAQMLQNVLEKKINENP